MILPPGAYAHVFGRWSGRTIAEFWGLGNTGDQLIRRGAETLYRAFNIQVTGSLQDAEAVFWGGGGNMGILYRRYAARRRSLFAEAQARRIPFVVLPQSWTSPERLPGAILFAREVRSLALTKGATLAPDLALAWTPPGDLPPIERHEGWFFRKDRESAAIVQAARSLGDPAALAKSAEDYVRLASRFAVIHTDRLHFAIAAMLAGRSAVLYPNSYFKNRAVYELWLHGRGCAWGGELAPPN